MLQIILKNLLELCTFIVLFFLNPKSLYFLKLDYILEET
jgi:hypothetical protein